MKKFAFTLTELLIALGIIGAISALAIPSLMTNINNKIHATQLKNLVSSIQQLASDQMVEHKTKNLANTDFSSSRTLFSHFTKIDKTPNWNGYRSLNNMGSYITAPDTIPSQSIILKSGSQISYNLYYDPNFPDIYAQFIVDVNGNDEGPNIIGRDLFAFFILKTGEVHPYSTAGRCKTGGSQSAHNCFYQVVNNGWKIPEYSN